MASKTKVKKITLRDRKKAQPNANLYFSEAERSAIIQTVAENLTPPQQSIYFYQCQALGLNPLLNEICAISYQGKMSIQVMRDGFLTIAHRSGNFAGMKSGVKGEGKDMVGWAKVYHKKFKVPMYQEADLSEYSTDKMLWASKPKTMIKKVAESMALRKAFNVSGVYAPEEMDLEIGKTEAPKQTEISNPTASASAEQVATIKALTKNKEQDELPEKLKGKKIKITRKEGADFISQLTERK